MKGLLEKWNLTGIDLFWMGTFAFGVANEAAQGHWRVVLLGFLWSAGWFAFATARVLRGCLKDLAKLRESLLATLAKGD